MQPKYTAVAVALAVSFSGCTTIATLVDKETAITREKATTKLSERMNTTEGGAYGSSVSIVKENGIWVGNKPVQLQYNYNLPAVFNTQVTFDRTVKDLLEFSERFNSRFGMRVKVSSDAITATSKIQTSVNPSASTSGHNGLSSSEIPIHYSLGSIKGLLDVVASKFGVSWRYSNDEIEFYHVDTKSFSIHAMPGDSALSASVSSGVPSGSGGTAGRGGGASGVSNNLALDSRLSVWTNIEKTVTSMLSPAGKVISSPATGSLTVTDVSDVLNRVGRYIEAENRSLKRQVVINVTVLGVTLNDSEGYGINWNSVYRTASSQFGIKNAFPADPISSTLSASILSTSSSKWAGSDVLINALSTQGKVRRDTALAVMALNNQPVPVLVAKQTTYLASSQTTQNVTTSSTSLTPGLITSGTNMTILPKVMEDGGIMLQLSASLSVLRKIENIVSGAGSIQAPEVDTRTFLQRVSMRSGETLVISGFEQNDGEIDRSGVGSPSNLLMGGLKANTSKEIFVIIITPTLLGSEAL